MSDAFAKLETDIIAALALYKSTLQPPPPPPPDVVVPVSGGDDLALALRSVAVGTILDLGGHSFVGNFKLSQRVQLRNGNLISPNALPFLTVPKGVTGAKLLDISGVRRVDLLGDDLCVDYGTGTRFERVDFSGNGGTKRGIAANGNDTEIRDSQILNITRPGTESNAVAKWQGKKLRIINTTLEGAGQSIMFGGAVADPDFALVPEDIEIDHCRLTRPMAWRGANHVIKTIIEFKSARNVRVVNGTILENMWGGQGQSGYAVMITPRNLENDQVVVEDVLFDNVVVENVANGVNLNGYDQHGDPSQQTTLVKFINSRWNITKANGPHGSFLMLGHKPRDIEIRGNQIAQDGDAFIRAADRQIVEGFTFTDNRVSVVGTYGTALAGLMRGAGWAEQFPGGVMNLNTFVGANSLFKTAFPDNTYE